ncbi:putative membrane protein [Candidatus Fokinia solitaria]|uniref:Putative membrane protein n=1 Tax=Candidatus Fokinia solitaria TaxID=1802984 RepID=A0A2U8BRW9_9RICK|nr:P-loop NTPase [Candidatus Fokinia solitaria]AWD33077.1 putative membrane protein [Candidatus Fokinia solitaria]
MKYDFSTLNKRVSDIAIQESLRSDASVSITYRNYEGGRNILIMLIYLSPNVSITEHEKESLKLKCTNVLRNYDECSADMRLLLHSVEIKCVVIQQFEKNVESPRILPNMQHKKEKKRIENVKNIIVVMSGKGGVGKSSVTVGIALSLRAQGFKVGIADLDVYGSSIPKFLEVRGYTIMENGIFIPPIAEGIPIMSADFLVPEDSGKVFSWRGPMITKMMDTILSLSRWKKENVFTDSDLDYLIIDTPPGTGDIHLSLLEKYDLLAHNVRIVLVSNESMIGLSNTIKSYELSKKFGLTLFGIICNMKLEKKDIVHQYIKNFDDINYLGSISFYVDLVSDACLFYKNAMLISNNEENSIHFRGEYEVIVRNLLALRCFS